MFQLTVHPRLTMKRCLRSLLFAAITIAIYSPQYVAACPPGQDWYLTFFRRFSGAKVYHVKPGCTASLPFTSWKCSVSEPNAHKSEHWTREEARGTCTNGNAQVSLDARFFDKKEGEDEMHNVLFDLVDIAPSGSATNWDQSKKQVTYSVGIICNHPPGADYLVCD